MMDVSPKQKELLQCIDASQDMILAEGAIRSGKTYSTVLAFLVWSQDQESQVELKRDYAIIGRSITTLDRNVLTTLRQFAQLHGASYVRNRSDSSVYINGIRYWLFGVNDVRASEKIMGATFNGLLIDEITLIKKDFVISALTRLTFAGSKCWGTYNPGNPGHWLKREFIDCKEERGVKLLQFTMDDNPILEEETKERYRRQFTGHYYQRFVEGEWCGATGLVYPMLIGEEPPEGDDYKLAFGMDYAHAGTWAMHEWRLYGNTWWCYKELYRNFEETAPLTDEDMVDLVVDWIAGRRYSYIFIDPATYVSWKKAAEYAGLRLTWRRFGRNDGIRVTSNMLFTKQVRISNECVETIKEGQTYAWDEKAMEVGKEEPIEGYDHAMDALRYFVVGAMWSQVNVSRKPTGF